LFGGRASSPAIADMAASATRALDRPLQLLFGIPLLDRGWRLIDSGLDAFLSCLVWLHEQSRFFEYSRAFVSTLHNRHSAVWFSPSRSVAAGADRLQPSSLMRLCV